MLATSRRCRWPTTSASSRARSGACSAAATSASTPPRWSRCTRSAPIGVAPRSPRIRIGPVMDLDVVTSAHPTAWTTALERAGWHDFYHEHWYHQLAEQRGEGRAELLVVAHGGRTFALPLLMRSIPGPQLQDATSVYGYAGPAGVFDGLDAESCTAITTAIRERLAAAGTVSLFSRLHPLRDAATLPAGAGKIVHAGTTVS